AQVGTTPSSILIFSASASGNVAPTRTITSTNAFVGVALDGSGNLFATIDSTTAPYSTSVVEYSSTASGAATPVRTISGAATELSTAGGLCIDGVGNIYVANQVLGSGTSSYSLATFSATASGNAAPTALLSSSS